MMGKRNINKILNILIICSLFLFVRPDFSSGQVIFEDNFDNQTDWSPTQTAQVDCWDNCTTAPSGYDSYRLQATCFQNTQKNTLNIDSTNYRGSSGKAFTFWNESCGGKGGWFSDGLLGKELDSNGYPELYVRAYIKFQAGWQWNKSTSPLQKFLRIVHFDGSGSPFKFFQDGNSRPASIIDLVKWNSGASDIAANINYRYENVYFPASAIPKHSDADTFYFGSGNYGGTGDDFGDPGMVGDSNWHSWEFYVKINSAAGVADGVMKFWVDGSLVAEVTNLAWSDEGSQTSPRKLWNYVMIGGNNYNGYTSYQQEQEQQYSIDDLVISTTYVGPDYVIGGSAPPDTLGPAIPPNTRQK